jgi:hypothetical protein
MNVTFIPFVQHMASARLRGSIPQRELKKLGVNAGLDIVVIGKHGWSEKIVQDFRKVVFDVCDDHFHDQHEGHYRKWCLKADLVTCNSLEMQDVIQRETGRHAEVIADPYEQPLRPAKVGRPPMWFGMGTNFGTIFPYLAKVPDLITVSNIQHPRVIQWSPEVMDKLFNRAGMVLIPVGEKRAKSANRAIDSIRRGLYPCTGRMPAYDELGLGTDDILAEMEHRLSEPQKTEQRIRDLQDLVEFRFSPATIGKEWHRVLSSI